MKRKVLQLVEEIKEEKKISSNHYLERIRSEYPITDKRIKDADEYVIKHFIDNVFAKKYRLRDLHIWH